MFHSRSPATFEVEPRSYQQTFSSSKVVIFQDILPGSDIQSFKAVTTILIK